MNKNKIAETAKKGQTAKKKQQPEKVVKALEKIKKRRENKQLDIEDLKKNTKVPNGKIKTLKEIEARKKAREENYRNFRINALKRRCKRMKVGKEDTNKYIEELKKQLDSPNTYHILIMFNNNDAQIVREGLKNNKIDWLMFCDHHAYVDGDSSTLDKIRSIVPIVKGNGVYPYVKRKPTIGPKANTHNEKKPTNNTTNKKIAAKAARKAIKMMKFTSRPHRKGKAAAKLHKRVTLLDKKHERLKSRKVPVTQLKNKSGSESVKKASTSLKKAA